MILSRLTRTAASLSVLFVLAATTSAQNKAPLPLVRVVDLRCEYKTNPLGIDAPAPRLSWRLEAADPKARGIMQSAYQIQVAASESALRSGKQLLWDSKRVSSSDSTQVPYAGPALESGHRYYWRVTIWEQRSAPSAWSAPAFFEMGLLRPTDWRASWIEPGLADDKVGGPAPLLRHEFEISPGFQRARLYVTSRGLYE